MPLIVNPCEVCVTYKTRLDEAKRMFIEGNSDATAGILTVTNNMLGEPLNPEIEALLKKYPGACTTERTLCIYSEADRAYLSRLKESAEAVYDHPERRYANKEETDAVVKDLVKHFRSMFPDLS